MSDISTSRVSGDFQPPLKREVELQIHQLKEAGKARDIEKIKQQIEQAKKINTSVIQAIGSSESTERAELLTSAKELIREIKALEGFQLDLEPKRSEIWVGKIITRLLFIAAKLVSPSKGQKQLAHAIEAAEKALSNPNETIEHLKSHLESITELRKQISSKKGGGGVIFDLSALCLNRLTFHIGYAEGENPYLKLSKAEQAELLLQEGKSPQTIDDVRLADFRKEAKSQLKPSDIQIGRDTTIDTIVDELGAALAQEDDLFLESLISQFKNFPHTLDSVELAIHKYPLIEARLIKLPSWQTAIEYRKLSKVGIPESSLDQWKQLMQLATPIDKRFWEQLKTLSDAERELILEFFPNKKAEILREANRLAELPPSEETHLLATALPTVEKLLEEEEGSLTDPFVTLFSDAKAADWRNNRSIHEIAPDKIFENPLEQAIHLKALDRLSQHIVDDFKTSLTELKNKQSPGSWYSKANGMLKNDLPLLQAIQKTLGIKGVDSLISTYQTLVDDLKVFSQLSEASIGAEVKAFEGRLAGVKTYNDLLALEKDILKVDQKALEDEITRLRESNPDLAQTLKSTLNHGAAIRERLTKSLLGEIRKQKEAISSIAMVSKNLSASTLKSPGLSSIKKGYEGLLKEIDPRTILERGIQLERESKAYLAQNKGDKNFESLRDQARLTITNAANSLMRTAKLQESQDQVLKLIQDLRWK